jgi:hypothetical protein
MIHAEIEFDQRRRIVPVAIQRWTKPIVVKLNDNVLKPVLLVFKETVKTSNVVSFDMLLKSTPSMVVKKL